MAAPRPPASQHSVSTSASTPSPTPRANIEARGGPPSERTPPTSMSSSRFTDAALAAVARREVKLARPSPNTGYETLGPLGGPGRRIGTPAFRRARLIVVGDTLNSAATWVMEQPAS